MLVQLFSSRVRVKLLSSFFNAPGVGFNAWELARSLEENYSAVWKELVHLEQAGVLTGEQRGKAKIYHLNPDNPILSELRSIVLKTEGVGKRIQEQLVSNQRIQAAFIYGSYASGEADARSDLDLMVIGDVDLTELSQAISHLEKDLMRPINYQVFTADEWRSRLARDDAFVSNVKDAPKIMLIGVENAL